MIGMFLGLLYFLVLEGLCGLSVGKRWFAVRALTEDDTVPTWSQHIVRTLIKSASMFLCAFPLAAISAIAGESWHDMAVGTKVVAFRK